MSGLRFASLGSGSGGNGLVAHAGASRLLLDCGFSLREVVFRLARLGLTPADIDGIIVTHEHDDHAGGVFALARSHGMPVWMSWGTAAALREADPLAENGVDLRLIHGGERFEIGDLDVLPFTVPHDAREPVQYVISDGRRRLGVLTDAGTSTPHIEQTLSGCDALVLEANHDAGLLAAGEYPDWLKARVGGPFGHLNNVDAGGILSAVAHSGLRHVVAAHLSKKNNTPELARAAFSAALGCTDEDVLVADQAGGFDWLECA